MDFLARMIALRPGGSLAFLARRSVPNIPEEAKGVRENILKDWNHIHETVISLGIPEIADVVGGQMFAGGHLR